jgi:ABC-type spermidine/putrescine transport system permease subunit I
MSAVDSTTAVARLRQRSRVVRRGPKGNWGMLTPSTLAYLLLFLVPLGFFVVYGFFTTGLFSVEYVLSTDAYHRALTEPLYREVILTTLWIAGLSAAIVTVISFAFCYFATFCFPKRRELLLMLVLISLFSGYLVRIFAWRTVLGSQGVINQTLEHIGVISAPLHFLLYSRFAVVLVLVNITLPFAIIPLYAAMGNVPKEALDASADLGSGPLCTLRTVLLPLVRRGLLTAIAFAFMLAAGDYVTPELVGGPNGQMVGNVIADQFGSSFDWPLASALGVITTIAAGVVLVAVALLLKVITRPSRGLPALGKAASRVGIGRRRHPRALRIVGAIFVTLVLVIQFLPVVLTILFSFNSSASLSFPLDGLSLRWYESLFGSEQFVAALRTSLISAGLTALIAGILGFTAAFGIQSLRSGRGRAEAVWTLPIVVPPLLLGVGLSLALHTLNVERGLPTIVAGHVLVALPFVILAMRAALDEFDFSLLEAARDLGATRTGALRDITWPLIRPSAISALFIAGALSMDEFIITGFVHGATNTVPTLLFGLLRKGVDPTANALATIVLTGTVLLATGSQILLARRRA